jgi:hypothetical protein
VHLVVREAAGAERLETGGLGAAIACRATPDLFK